MISIVFAMIYKITNWLIGGAILIVLAYLFTISQSRVVEDIKIGFVLPLTGDAATYGEPMKNAASIAVEEINKSGGIDGRRIVAIFEDSKCEGKIALTAVQKLVSIDNVKLISGFTCAEDLLSASPVLEQNKILALAPGASSPQVTLAGDYIFQNNPSATIAAKQLAGLIIKKYKNIATINEKTGFATDINDYFVKEFKSLGGTVVASESYTSDTRDFRNIVTKIKGAEPEVIFVNPQTEISGGAIIKQIRDLQIKVPLYGMDTISGEKTREIAGSAIDGLTILAVPGLGADNKKAHDFLEKYKNLFGEPSFDLYIGASYDSVYLLAQGIREVGYDATKIKDYLYQLGNYDGVIGNYSFDHNGDLVGIDFVVKKIVGGELVEESSSQ